MHIYIYIYIERERYIYIYIYIYIYLSGTANLPTDIVDFGGFDSSIILI